LERDRQDVGANLLHERLGANADIEAEESGAVWVQSWTWTTKLTSHPS